MDAYQPYEAVMLIKLKNRRLHFQPLPSGQIGECFQRLTGTASVLVRKFEDGYARKLLHHLVKHDSDEVHRQRQMVSQEEFAQTKILRPINVRVETWTNAFQLSAVKPHSFAMHAFSLFFGLTLASLQAIASSPSVCAGYCIGIMAALSWESA